MRSSSLLFVLALSACAADPNGSNEAIEDARVASEDAQTAKMPNGIGLWTYAQSAEQLCDVGDWCLFGAFQLNTDYEDMGGTPNTDYFDPIQGQLVLFAQSFNIAVYDQFTLPDPLVHTSYDITDVHARFACRDTICSDMTTDMDGGHSSGMHLFYDWYTDRTSEVPGIFYGSVLGFQIYQPENADMIYTPGTLGNVGYFPEVTDNKGEAFAIVRRYDAANWPAMTDFATGDAFFYLVQQ